MARKDVRLLACMRATAPLTVPGSDFSRSCTLCHTRVMIAPSGQRALEADPKMKIVCVRCVRRTLKPEDIVTLPMALDATLDEAATSVPNLWRERN